MTNISYSCIKQQENPTRKAHLHIMNQKPRRSSKDANLFPKTGHTNSERGICTAARKLSSSRHGERSKSSMLTRFREGRDRGSLSCVRGKTKSKKRPPANDIQKLKQYMLPQTNLRGVEGETETERSATSSEVSDAKKKKASR